MQFRLVYQGKLRPQTRTHSQVGEKHEIRRILHQQMFRLWEGHPFLRQLLDEFKEGRKYVESDDGRYVFEEDPTLSVIADRYHRFGYRFIPLVGESFGASACSLDILFLRRDHPGNLISSGGDIDNRIKVLFDALRMPHSFAEVCEQPPRSNETPFFCLMEDDRLITE